MDKVETEEVGTENVSVEEGEKEKVGTGKVETEKGEKGKTVTRKGETERVEAEGKHEPEKDEGRKEKTRRKRQVRSGGRLRKFRGGFLVPQEWYLEAGVHIGTKVKTGPMREFIYMRRNDGLYVLDIKKTDERLRKAAKILSRYEPQDIIVTASRVYSSIAGANFAKVTGAWLYPGRFIPGVLTNPYRPDFMEPKILIVSDPRGEREAIIEAGKMGIPVIALCDTDNVTRYIDYVIPCNNKGRKSLALMFYLLAREYLMSRGVISSYSEFKYPLKMFSDDTALKEIKEKQEKLLSEKHKTVKEPEETKEVIESIVVEQAEGELTEEEPAEPPPDAAVKKENVPLETSEQ